MSDANENGKAPGQEVVEHGKLRARDIQIGRAGINFTNAGEVMAFANMMAQSGFAVRAPFRNSPGACLAIIDDAIRFGMSPYALARGAYLVNDQLAYESKIVAAVIIGRAPIRDLPEYAFAGAGDGLRCTVTIELVSGKKITHQSPPLGRIVPRNSPLWTSDPEQQLGYYTIRAMARRHFPHTLAGIYDLEEAAAARTIDVTPLPEPSGLVHRLAGPSGEGFVATEAPSTGPVVETEPVIEAPPADEPAPAEEPPVVSSEQPAAELSDDERTLLADMAAEFATTTTELEVRAVWVTFEESLNHARPVLQVEAGKKFDAKLAKVKKARKKP